jgi:exodeoxyribonuclease-3
MGPKFDYKLAWFDRLIRHAATLYNTDAPSDTTALKR